MSVLEMKVPSPGESITEVEIATWLVSDGDYVEKDQTIAEVDSDKATLELPAESSGVITLKAAEGDVVKVGQVVCLIDTSAERPAGLASPAVETVNNPVIEETKQISTPNPDPIKKDVSYASGTPSPAAAKIMVENNVSAAQVSGSGRDGRITKSDVVNALAAGFDANSIQGWGGSREQSREKMSMLRRKIAERLVSVKNETAMLTTFNEVDMKPIMDIRAKYKEAFAKHHEVNLGFMSFFTKAVTEALNLFPAVNGQIDGNEVVFHNYADIYDTRAWIKYKKYVCLLCEDGELVDITDEAIEGVPVYVREDSDLSGYEIIDENFIYSQSPSGGVRCGGSAYVPYKYKETMGGGIRCGGSAYVEEPLGFYFGKFNNYLDPETNTEPEVVVETNTEPEVVVETNTEPEVVVETNTEPEVVIETNTEPEVAAETNTEPVNFAQTAMPFLHINRSSLQSLGTTKLTEVGSTVDYSFVYFEKYIDDYADGSSGCDATSVITITRVILPGGSQKDLNDLIETNVDHAEIFSYYYPDLVSQCVETYDFEPQDLPMIDEFRRYDQPPTSLDCTDQEPIGYLCKDKLTRTLEKWEPASGALERRDRRSWCEHTKKGTFYETTICEEVTCPEALGMASVYKPQNTTTRSERRKNPLP
jgi:hypothetical protein